MSGDKSRRIIRVRNREEKKCDHDVFGCVRCIIHYKYMHHGAVEFMKVRCTMYACSNST